MRRLTQSELRTFKRCRRKWWLQYQRRLRLQREKTTGAAPLGTRVHDALEALYASGHDTEAMWAHLNGAYDRAVAESPEDEAELRKEHDLARAMLEGYVEWLAETGADEDLELIAAEEAVEVPFSDVLDERVVLLGKLDQRVRRISTGERMFMDHKTVDDFSRVSLLALDEQMMHYHLLEHLKLIDEGKDPDEERTGGGIFNMLRKVKRTSRAKPPFYMRSEVRHNKTNLRAYWARVYATVADMITVERVGFDAAYPNPTRDCSWDCPFLPICPMFDDGSDVEGVIEMFYDEGNPLERYDRHGTVRQSTGEV